MTFYINPQIYKAEMDQAAGGSEYEKVNHEFAQQSAYGRATGKMKSSPALEGAIKKFYERKANGFKDSQTITDMNLEEFDKKSTPEMQDAMKKFYENKRSGFKDAVKIGESEEGELG